MWVDANIRFIVHSLSLLALTMKGSLDLKEFPESLQKGINNVIEQCPTSETVFKELIDYLQNGKQGNNGSLKRKRVSFGSVDIVPPNLGINSNLNTGVSIEKLQNTNIMLQLPELSIQSPFRKRLNLVFGAVKNEKRAYLALSKSLDTTPEFIIRTLTDDNIIFAAILNVPEKKPLRYLLVSYKENDGNMFKNDPLLIQFNNDQLEEQFGSILGGKSFVQYLTTQLMLVNFKITDYTQTDETFFVGSYKGTKEGYLYFLPNHVVFGFKKPILIFKSQDIESITYNSITRLTFNVLLDVRIYGVVEQYEFSMIDQKEFEKIDKYVKGKEFRDNSMADEHKAQKQLKNNTDAPGDLAEAAKLVPGGNQIVATNDDDDDDEDDDNYQIGDSDDDHSDVSEPENEEHGDEDDDDEDDNEDYNGEDDDEDDDDDDEYQGINEQVSSTVSTITPGLYSNMDDFGSFDDNLQQELQDLQKDLDIDINELQKAGYL